MTRQAYYQHCWREECVGVEQEMVLREVAAIRKDHRSMGARKVYEKIHPFLLEHGIKMGRDALFDLLASHGLLVRKRRRRVSTTMSYHRFRKWPNLTRDYVPTAPNQLYVSDITYWKIQGRHVYISLVTDAYSHKIVGHHVADTLEVVESKQAIARALSDLPRERCGQLIHHSDRGIQYCSSEYVSLLQDNGIRISMTENSEPTENAIAERVNGILKEEYLSHYLVTDLEQAREKLEMAVKLYNGERPHMSIGNLTPDQVHQSDIKTERLWKNYYRKPEQVNLFQD